MKNLLLLVLLPAAATLVGCDNEEETPVPTDPSITGYELLTDLAGHWVGSNETAFGNYEWFAFDFRPISASHLHSIYEGGTNQNIITSVFIADYDGKQQIMARNGGWLGNQYRATYFRADRAEYDGTTKYYRLSDAVGGENRAYMEFRFRNDSLYFDAYKDNSGSLDEPIHHMGFRGTNLNSAYAQPAIDRFGYPQPVSEVDLEGKFVDLIDPDSALFLEEADDPFPKSQHGHVSDLRIDIVRDDAAEEDLLLYISKEPIVSSAGAVDFENLNTQVIRTIDVRANEAFYLTTYLHPDRYYLTVFADRDGNFFPSAGDVSSVSTVKEVQPEEFAEAQVIVDLQIP